MSWIHKRKNNNSDLYQNNINQGYILPTSVKKCKHCNNMIPSDVKVCPICKKKVKPVRTKKRKWLR